MQAYATAGHHVPGTELRCCLPPASSDNPSDVADVFQSALVEQLLGRLADLIRRPSSERRRGGRLRAPV